MIELANTVALAIQEEPVPMTVVFGAEDTTFERFDGSTKNRFSIFNEYDVRRALEGWACFTDDDDAWTDDDPNRTIVDVDAKEVYYIRNQTIVGNLLRGYILGQIMLRPTTVVRHNVLAFEASLNVGQNGYVAIHLRWLENNCVDWMVKRSLNGHLSRRSSNRTYDAVAVCNMTDAYITESLKQAPKNLPIVLAHDHERLDLADEIRRKWNATSYDGDFGEAVDVQLLLRAHFVIGNPASTLSANVNDVRCAMSKTHQSYSNMLCRNSNPSTA